MWRWCHTFAILLSFQSFVVSHFVVVVVIAATTSESKIAKDEQEMRIVHGALEHCWIPTTCRLTNYPGLASFLRDRDIEMYQHVKVSKTKKNKHVQFTTTTTTTTSSASTQIPNDDNPAAVDVVVHDWKQLNFTTKQGYHDWMVQQGFVFKSEDELEELEDYRQLEREEQTKRERIKEQNEERDVWEKQRKLLKDHVDSHKFQPRRFYNEEWEQRRTKAVKDALRKLQSDEL